MSRSRSISILSSVILVLLMVGSASAQTTDRRDTDVEPGWLGVSIQDVTGELREALPRSVNDGVIVNAVVEGSPADDAGLKEGDIITRFNRQQVRETDDLTRSVRRAGAGRTVDIEYYRDGRLVRDRVKLGEREEPESYRKSKRAYGDALRWFSKGDDDEDEDEDGDHDVFFFDEHSPALAFFHQFGQKGRLGVKLMDLGEQLAAYFDVTEDDGPLVIEVLDETPAAAAGLKAGDIIIRIGDAAVEDADDVREVIAEYDEAGALKIEVIRHGRRQTVTAELPEQDKVFGKRGRRYGRLHVEPGKGLKDIYMPDVRLPALRGDRKELEQELKDMRRELKQMQKELQKLQSDRP